MHKFPKGSGFELSDAVGRDAKFGAHLFERVLAFELTHAETHIEDDFFPRVEHGSQYVGEDFAGFPELEQEVRRRRLLRYDPLDLGLAELEVALVRCEL